MSRAAVIQGVFLRPGISRNQRIYTKENIARAVSRMQERLANDEVLPITMFTSHGAAAEDDATSTIAQVTRVGLLPSGEATFEADIANTTKGRDIAALAVPDPARNGRSFIKGISIRGQWLGDVRRVETESGESGYTADDLEIDGIDFTHRPGVEGARITDGTMLVAESAKPLNVYKILESVDAELREELPKSVAQVITEADAADVDITAALWAAYEKVKAAMAAQAFDMDDQNDAEVWAHLEDLKAALKNALVDQVGDMQEESVAEGGDAPGNGKKPYGNVTYADPGYQADKKKRYPIDTAAHVRAAWGYINKGKNAGAYSSGQLARIKSKIKRAAKKFGIEIAAEADALRDEFIEMMGAYGSIISEAAAYEMALDALAALYESPEEAIGQRTDDNNMEGGATTDVAAISNCPECGVMLPEDGAMYCPTCGFPVPQAESTATTNMEEAQVADTATTTEAPAAPVTEAREPTWEDVHSAYAAGVASGSANAGPKPQAAPAPSTGGTAVPSPVESTAGETTTETAPEEGAAMTTESASAPAGFTTEALADLVNEAVAKAVKKAVKKIGEGAPAAPAAAPAATEDAPTGFSQEQVQAAVEAAVSQATEAARAQVVEELRSSGTMPRKGLVAEGTPVSSVTEEDELRSLAKMSPSALREAAAQALATGGSAAWRATAPRLHEGLQQVPASA